MHRRADGSRLAVRDLDRLHAYLTSDASTPRRHDPLPTIAYNGETVLLSPELLRVTSAEYDDFIAGNVLSESIPAMLASMHRHRYMTEFAAAL